MAALSPATCEIRKLVRKSSDFLTSFFNVANRRSVSAYRLSKSANQSSAVLMSPLLQQEPNQ